MRLRLHPFFYVWEKVGRRKPPFFRVWFASQTKEKKRKRKKLIRSEIKTKKEKERKKKMIKFKRGYKYTIVYTDDVRAVANEHPYAKVILLDQDGENKLIAIEEKEY